MTAKISNYGVDLYKIAVNPGGTIQFDIGNGELIVNGDLTVNGNTTIIESSELVIADNTITVNAGEAGSGVTLGTAGMIIDRGSLPNAQILFNEDISFLDSRIGSNTIGALTFANEDDNLVGLYTNFIGTYDNYNLILLGNGSTGSGTILSRVTVAGTTDYEKNIFSYTGDDITFNGSNEDRLALPVDDDAIPNVALLKDYVRSYHLYNWQNKIVSPLPDGDTSISVFTIADGAASNGAKVAVSGIDVITVSATQTTIEEIKIIDNSITPLGTNTNLVLQAAGTGSVEFPDPLNLTKDTDPVAPADGVKLYSKAEADGGTGLFFINENNTNDEIISRNKALLYSIIF
jgi:hypothetical protein